MHEINRTINHIRLKIIQNIYSWYLDFTVLYLKELTCCVFDRPPPPPLRPPEDCSRKLSCVGVTGQLSQDNGERTSSVSVYSTGVFLRDGIKTDPRAVYRNLLHILSVRGVTLMRRRSGRTGSGPKSRVIVTQVVMRFVGRC